MTREDDITRPVFLYPILTKEEKRAKSFDHICEETQPIDLPLDKKDSKPVPEDQEITRPITLPPRPKCAKPKDSFCMFRDPMDNTCAKRITTCIYKVSVKKEN